MLLALALAGVLVAIGAALSSGGQPSPGWQKVVAGLGLLPVLGVMVLLGQRVVDALDEEGFAALDGAFAASVMVLMLVGPVMVALFWQRPTTHRFTAAVAGLVLSLALFAVVAV